MKTVSAHRQILKSKSWDAQDRSTDVFASVVVYSLLALFLAMIPVGVLGKVIDDKSVLKALYAILVIGAAIWAYVATRFYGEPLWESTTWLDFDERSWNHEIRYAVAGAPASLTRLRFDDLALMCHDSLYGEGIDEVRYYHVYLCRRWDAEQLRAVHRPEELTDLQSVTTEEESLAFALDTARRWDLPCWRHQWTDPGSADGRTMTRLC
ncbi:hypothetical protein INH39_26380 [Massilia violaceinigra]|uniref:Uncharacterized protein n=1 Tax=Massilia violaceinigra TaxID=2045208 RepID=A0ABY4A2E7_9BURK|nr:hypothetical protein [Massilia violaceinigra]UOD28930.1 hypothetical protein INH39_26380 [Massilia violaceinigra]